MYLYAATDLIKHPKNTCVLARYGAHVGQKLVPERTLKRARSGVTVTAGLNLDEHKNTADNTLLGMIKLFFYYKTIQG